MTMPRYGYGQDDFYQGTGFDPYSGRMNGGQLIAQIIGSIAEGKRRKKEAGWEEEDRAWQKTQRARDEEQYGRAKEQYDYEKSIRVDPGKKATFDWWKGAMEAKAQEQARMREIEAGKKANIEIAQAKPVKTRQELDKEYLGDVEAVDKDYTAKKWAARTEASSALKEIMKNAAAYEPAEIAAMKADIAQQLKESNEFLDEQYNIIYDKLDERYGELPRATANKKRRDASRKPTVPVVDPNAAPPVAPVVEPTEPSYRTNPKVLGNHDRSVTATTPRSYPPAVERLALQKHISNESALRIYRKWLEAQAAQGVPMDKLLAEMNK